MSLIKTVSILVLVGLGLISANKVHPDHQRHMAAAHQAFDLEFALTQESGLDDSGINLDENIEAKFAAALVQQFPSVSHVPAA